MKLRFIDIANGNIIDGRVYISGVYSKPGHMKIKFRTEDLSVFFIPVNRVLKVETSNSTITDTKMIAEYFSDNYSHKDLIEAEEALKNSKIQDFVKRDPMFDFNLKKALLIGKMKGLNNSDLQKYIERQGGVVTTNLNNTVDVAVLVFDVELPTGKKIDLLREYKSKGSEIEIVEICKEWLHR